MDSISGGMKSLCEDIATAHGDRKRAIKDLRKEAEAIRDNARRFVGDCKRLHKEMAKDLKKNLLRNKEELTKSVSSLRDDFRKKEEDIRSDLEEAKKAWDRMNETLRSKKAKSRSAKGG